MEFFATTQTKIKLDSAVFVMQIDWNQRKTALLDFTD
jgi:hypothetical protein